MSKTHDHYLAQQILSMPDYSTIRKMITSINTDKKIILEAAKERDIQKIIDVQNKIKNRSDKDYYARVSANIIPETFCPLKKYVVENNVCTMLGIEIATWERSSDWDNTLKFEQLFLLAEQESTAVSS